MRKGHHTVYRQLTEDCALEIQDISVSVIIPIYNSEDYLKECLNSLLEQTHQCFEAICVDDGSIDRSREIIQRYQQIDNRIKVVFKEHENAGAARNLGLQKATGKYIAFLDADDFIKPTMLEECVRILEKDSSDIVVFSADRFNMMDGVTEHMPWSLVTDYLPLKNPFAPREMKKYLFNAFQNWPWNKMFRRAFIESARIWFQSIERTNDMAFVCQALVKARNISIITEPLITYRVGSQRNLQATNYRTPSAFWKAFIETKARLVSDGLYEDYEQSFLNWILDSSLYNLHMYQNDVSNAYINGLLKVEGESEFSFLSHPRSYYYQQWQYDEYKAIVESDELEAIENIRRSRSYRIGRAMTFLPRKLRDYNDARKKRKGR